MKKHTRSGDWEVDLIIRKEHQGAVVTLTKRKSRFALATQGSFETD